jgi:hypothetical protein
MNTGARLDFDRHMRKAWQSCEPFFVETGRVRMVGYQGNDSSKVTGSYAPKMKV